MDAWAPSMMGVVLGFLPVCDLRDICIKVRQWGVIMLGQHLLAVCPALVSVLARFAPFPSPERTHILVRVHIRVRIDTAETQQYSVCAAFKRTVSLQ